MKKINEKESLLGTQKFMYNDEFLTVDNLDDTTENKLSYTAFNNPHYQPLGKFNPENNIPPCIYGSPEQMCGIHIEKKKNRPKTKSLSLFLIFLISVSVILITLILLSKK